MSSVSLIIINILQIKKNIYDCVKIRSLVYFKIIHISSHIKGKSVSLQTQAWYKQSNSPNSSSSASLSIFKMNS
jgi:hypothetical protein